MKFNPIKYFLITLCCLLLVAESVDAQSHVYQNKKNVIRYEFSIWHAKLFGVKGTPLPTIKNGICFERMMTDNSSINLIYSRMDMVDNEFATHQVLRYSPPTPVAAMQKGKYSSNTIEFIIKKFGQRSNVIHPMGRYFLLGVFYKYETIQSNAVTYDLVSFNNIGYLDLYKAKIHDGGITIGFGNNSIIKNNLVLGFEFKISLPFKAIYDYTADNAYGRAYDLRLESQDVNELSNRRILYNLFTFKTTFGIIY